jgi:biopolymer transport protein ExbD
MAIDTVDEDQATNSINITPLVDVSLVLLLIFMVTMPMSLIHGITVRRQALEKYGLSTPQENIQIHLTERGILIKDAAGANHPIPYDQFGVVLSQMIQISPIKNVYLQINKGVPHGQTVWALDIAKQNGANDLSILENE